MTPTPLTGSTGRALDYPAPGEAVVRHASTFRRDWPDLTPKPIEAHPPPEVTATRVELADLELAARLLADAPTAVATAVRNANAGRWRWTLDYGCGRALGRPEVVSESLVLRTARSPVVPWRTLRMAAVWRRTGGAGPWSFDVAFRWALDGRLVTSSAERLSAGELGWALKTGGEHTTNPRPPRKRRESAAVVAAREEIDACPA